MAEHIIQKSVSGVAAIRASELSARKNRSVVFSEQKKLSSSWTWLHRSQKLSLLTLTAQIIFAYESKLLRPVPSGFLL